MQTFINENLKKVVESPTLLLNAQAQELQKLHKDFINLTVGEPDMMPPVHVRQAVIDAIHSGLYNRYTPVGGTQDLKKSIAQYFSGLRKIPTSMAEVMATSGCKQAIFNALFATLNPGDEVLIVAPYWLAYSEIVLMLGAIPRIIDTTSTAGRLQADDLERQLSLDTKWLILNTPCNPTGVVYTQQELSDMGAVLNKFPQVHILSDEIYAFLTFNKMMAPSFLGANPQLVDRTVIVDGISKFLAVTGWRLGFCRAPEKLIREMTKVQSQSTSNPSTLSQVAAVAGLDSVDFNFVHDYVDELHKRASLVCSRLDQMNLEYFAPQGAFYVFCDFRKHLQALGVSDEEFCRKLMHDFHLCIVPGSAFAASGFARICLTKPASVLQEAIQRIQTALQ